MKRKKPNTSLLSWKDIIILAAVTAIVAWAIATAGAADVNYHHARSAIAIAYHLKGDGSDSDICPACNGAGEIGDGRIMHKCEECDGTGKRVTQVVSNGCDNPLCFCDDCDCGPNCQCGQVIEPPPDPVIELSEPIEVEWSEAQPVTEAPGQIYLLSEQWCRSCPLGKKNATEAGIDYEVVTVQQAAGLGLIPYGESTTIPRLIHSLNTDDPLAGAVSADRMKAWAAQQPQPAKSDPIVTATIHSRPSASATLAALAEHLARTKDASAVPVGGLFDRDVETPVIVPQLLSQLMAGETISVPDSGISAVWTGEKRSITFESRDTVALTPPLSVKLSKWGLSVNTILRGCTVTDEGQTIQFDLKGPDFTVRFVP